VKVSARLRFKEIAGLLETVSLVVEVKKIARIESSTSKAKGSW
jgi:hypothetical protein